MQYRIMGRTGLKVSELCLGTMTYGYQVAEEDSIEIIKTAVESGINFFDTADVYAGGRSEEILGKALKGNRHSMVIATKVANPTGPGVNDIGLSRKHIMRAVEGSLQRLGTDYIDLYYTHFPDNTPLEETLRAMDDLVHQGKVRYIGCSNYRAWLLCKSLWVSDVHNLTRFECIEPPYNLLIRDIEYELLPLCESEKVGVCVYNPLAGGLLTGKYNLKKPLPEGSRFSIEYAVPLGGIKMEEKDKKGAAAKGVQKDSEKVGLGPIYRARYWKSVNFEMITNLEQIARKRGRTLAQFALAWILSNNTITSALTSVTSLSQLEENLASVSIKLEPDELSSADEVWVKLNPPRYPYGR